MGFSLVDQGIFSGANFILNVLLARWLAPVEYGAFAVAYSLFLFLSAFHNALILDPMSVLQPAQKDIDFFTYLGRVIWAHTGLATALVVVTAVCGALVAGEGPLREAIWGLALGMPAMLPFLLLRRAQYLQTRPGSAAIGSLVYAVTLLAGIVALWEHGWLSALSAFVFMGVASVVASVVSWRRLGVAKKVLAQVLPGPGIMSLAWDHWRYGKWVAVAAVLSLAVSQVQTFLAAAILGIEAAGVLRAMQTFTFPMTQAIIAISVLALPVLSGKVSRGRSAELRPTGLLISVGLTGVALAYEIVLLTFGGTLGRLLYADRYDSSAWLIPLLGLWPVMIALGIGFSLTLRALQKPQFYAYAGAVTVPLGFISAVVFTKAWGLGGTAASIVVSEAVSSLITIGLCRRWTADARAGAGAAN